MQISRLLQITNYFNKDCSLIFAFHTRWVFTQTGISCAYSKSNYIYYWSFKQKIFVHFHQRVFIKVHRSPRPRRSTAMKQLNLDNPETSVPGWRKMHFCTQDLNLRFWPWQISWTNISWTNSWDLSFLLQIDPYPITAYSSQKTGFHRDSTATCNSSQEITQIRRPGLMLLDLHHGGLISRVSSIRRSRFCI